MDSKSLSCPVFPRHPGIELKVAGIAKHDKLRFILDDFLTNEHIAPYVTRVPCSSDLHPTPTTHIPNDLGAYERVMRDWCC